MTSKSCLPGEGSAQNGRLSRNLMFYNGFCTPQASNLRFTTAGGVTDEGGSPSGLTVKGLRDHLSPNPTILAFFDPMDYSPSGRTVNWLRDHLQISPF